MAGRSKYRYVDIDVRVTFQGAYALSVYTGSGFIEKQYFGYTKREALSLFHAMINA